MVKDEDVCLHCGLCAERCPTAAWDMQQFWYNVTKADHRTYNAGATGAFVKLTRSSLTAEELVTA